MKIDGFAAQQLFQIQNKAAVEGLNVGELIQGRVLAMENGMLLLRLLDGSSLTAKVPEGFDLLPGTLLTLQIGETAGDQITARIVDGDAPPRQESAAENTLSQIARQLQTFGAKATGDMVSKVLSLLENHPGLDMEKAAFLTANGMESDPAMLATALKLANREFNLAGNLQALSRSLAESLSAADRADVEELLRTLMFRMEMAQAVRELAGRLADVHNGVSREDLALGGGIKLLLTRELLNALEGSLNAYEPLDTEKLFEVLQKALSNLKASKAMPGGGLNIPDEQLKEILHDFIRTTEGIRLKTAEMFRQEKPDVQKILESVFEKAYTRIEDDGASSIDLNDKLETLKEILQLASESARLAGERGSHAIRPVVQELTDALRFFSQVNTYHVFMHIPLVIREQQTIGELYIMKRKPGKGRINPKQFTLFISLHTQNLGLVETFLNASHGCLTIHFRVESQELADFVRAHHKELYEALGKKGYKLAEMKCRVLESEPVNLVSAGKITESVLGMNARFDLRI